jgi:hypothetical protein
VTWDITSLTKQALDGRIKVKANGGLCRIMVSTGLQSAEITIESDQWSELPLPVTIFNQGLNHCRLTVLSGDLSIDCIDFR